MVHYRVTNSKIAKYDERNNIMVALAPKSLVMYSKTQPKKHYSCILKYHWSNEWSRNSERFANLKDLATIDVEKRIQLIVMTDIYLFVLAKFELNPDENGLKYRFVSQKLLSLSPQINFFTQI